MAAAPERVVSIGENALSPQYGVAFLSRILPVHGDSERDKLSQLNSVMPGYVCHACWFQLTATLLVSLCTSMAFGPCAAVNALMSPGTHSPYLPLP